MGGEEDLRRSSHESYRSRHSFSIDAPELVRKSVDRVRSIGKIKRGSPRITNTQSSSATFRSKDTGSISSQENITPFEDIMKPDEVVPLKAVPGVGQGLQTAYLLVSPLQGMVGSLATMWSSKGWKSHASTSEHEMKLSIDPTLALFGDDDIFVSVKKLRAWAQKLVDAGNASKTSRFRYAEVKNAGHFWHNHEAMKILTEEIATFTREL